MTSTNLPVLILKRNEDRRLSAGHLWVYSNEVDTRQSPLSAFEPGSLAVIQSAAGKTLGAGYVNPRSLICARLLTRRPRAALDAGFFERRLRTALSLRESLFEQPYYRLVFGESDGLPGLVVDRYGSVLVVQITTAGMEAVRDLLLEVLDRIFSPSGMLLRNDSSVRLLEGLTQETQVIGEVPETVVLTEGGVQFEVPLGAGQKTGWFYDQRSNRQAMHKYVKGKRVLDVFSYIGAWGLQAAAAGAAEVKEHIKYMKPSTSKGSGPYKESMVEIKLETVTMKQLVGYLHRIESPKNVTSIKRISIKGNKKEPGYLDVVLQVLTLNK